MEGNQEDGRGGEGRQGMPEGVYVCAGCWRACMVVGEHMGLEACV